VKNNLPLGIKLQYFSFSSKKIKRPLDLVILLLYLKNFYRILKNQFYHFSPVKKDRKQ
jgi:hypothetical protein